MHPSRKAAPLLGLATLAALGLAATAPALAQTPTAITTLFSTGVANGGSLVADAAADPHYTIVSSADTAHQGPAVYVVNQTGYPIGNPWLLDGPNSKWIAPQANENDNSGQGPGADPAGRYTYQTTFSLSGFAPATAKITGQWATDDFGDDILINGVSTGITSHGATAGDSGSTVFTSFTISSGFQPGVNTLQFIVRNASPAGGANFNPTGLRVEITGQALATPEPSQTAALALGALGLSSLMFRARRRRA